MLALTRPPGPNLQACELTWLKGGPIDVRLAMRQHAAYEESLRALGCDVSRLPPLDDCPDAVFVEDAAVVLPELAILCRPGAPSRQPETASVLAQLRLSRPVAAITAPATLDGGDVLCLGRRLYVGIGDRSTQAACAQLAEHAAPQGYEVVPVRHRGCLHLKTAVTALDAGTLILNPAWVDPATFAGFRILTVDPAEPFAANTLTLTGKVLAAAAHPLTNARILRAGFDLMTVDISELAKAEAGLTCCSLIVT